MESEHVVEVQTYLSEENLGRMVADMYQRWKSQRLTWEAEKKELRNFIFQTDTGKTTVGQNTNWKNSTSRPKICQIRDNLHANYMSALFPHEDFFKWKAGSADAALKEKATLIENYIRNKLEQSGFRAEVEKLVYDYIDYGNAFGEVVSEAKYHQTEDDPTATPVYVGPKLQRISPLDIIFDLTAPDFHSAPTITRSLVTLGSLRKLQESRPDAGWVEGAFDAAVRIRRTVSGLGTSDSLKVDAFEVDGFGTPYQYFTSGLVEILEFEGDIYDIHTDELLSNRKIIVIDRAHVLFNAPYESWLGRSNKEHVGWRQRPDNLMAMGPLDNLVGMQYRIDHLENLRADVFDQIAHPVVYQKGYVEDWSWGPGEKILGDEESDVRVFSPDATALNADFQIAQLEQSMEEMAGAPRQAMGIRTPGEKTAFEVQALDNAAGRVFQNKVSHFENVFIEPILNQMLEAARRNIDVTDVVRVMDDDFGVVEFLTITKEDIQASGKLVPMGARHYARQNQITSNLFNLANSALYQDPAVQVHLSGVKIAELVEELLELDRFDLSRPNIRVVENQQTQALAQQGTEQNATAATVSPELISGALDQGGNEAGLEEEVVE